MFKKTMPFNGHRTQQLLLIALLFVGVSPAVAQQSTPPSMPEHQHHTSVASNELFPVRDASGTAWLPDQTPMFGARQTWGRWEVMLNGVAYAEFLGEPGNVHRTGGFSSKQFVSTNWGMLMAR